MRIGVAQGEVLEIRQLAIDPLIGVERDVCAFGFASAWTVLEDLVVDSISLFLGLECEEQGLLSALAVLVPFVELKLHADFEEFEAPAEEL